MTHVTDELLSVTQCAAHHGLTRSVVLLAIARNDLPARKVGKVWVIQHADCEAYTPALTPQE
jgi:hypothetical protein